MTSADSSAAVATSNLRLKKKGRREGGEEIGREIKSSVAESGALQLQPSIISVNTAFLFILLFSSDFICLSLSFKKRSFTDLTDEGQKNSHADVNSPGDGVHIWLFQIQHRVVASEVPLLSNLKPERQTQYPDQRNWYYYIPAQHTRVLFTLGVNAERLLATGGKRGR